MEGSCMLRRVALSEEDVHKFYHKSCKEGFWPVLHTFPEKYNYHAVDWPSFEAINRRFAMAACEEADDEAIIWIHDYNLWMAPYYIRQQKPRVRIAFFFHTPFPCPDVFNILHWREKIIESLLCCDLINFDIPRYAENFVNTARSLFKLRVKKRRNVKKYFASHGGALSEPLLTHEILYRDHIVRLDSFPEGTNYELIKKIMAKNSTIARIEDIKRQKNGCKLIFAPSRVDYIKGTVELLQCYERLLIRKSELKEDVMLFVVAVHPKEGISAYNDVREDIEQLVIRINDRFSSAVWKPVLYSSTSLCFEEMIAWFSTANILWVPSLRDGMNIICKEFVAVKKDSSGVLILSEFAGAAVELGEAVLTNPYSPESMNAAIDLALSMSHREQKRKMNKMFKKMLLSDINVWSTQLNELKHAEIELQKV
jgi:glucosylglycerol-phosphate synthase